ncbi:unnamed protein product, partial [Scytosiphon promiscuus]
KVYSRANFAQGTVEKGSTEAWLLCSGERVHCLASRTKLCVSAQVCALKYTLETSAIWKDQPDISPFLTNRGAACADRINNLAGQSRSWSRASIWRRWQPHLSTRIAIILA